MRMMSRPEIDDYLAPYRAALNASGTDFDVTLWASPLTQQKRFEVFTQMLFLTGKRILDAGCSRGDFAAHLLKHHVEYGQYIGVDALEEVILYARQRNLPRASFHCGDFVADPKLLTLHNPQVIALSGTLNTMAYTDALRVLEASWSAAGETLIFNFLSDRATAGAPPQGLPARRHNTLALLDWAMEKTWAVHFRHDYFQFGHDATIVMRKP